MTKEEAIKTLRELWRETNDSWYEEAYNMAIEALQERPKGKWKKKLGTLYCSVCGNSWSFCFEDLLNNFNYCPNCGSQMRGEDDD